MRNLIFLIITLVPLSAYGIVDMKNSNFSDTWTDLKLPGTGYTLRVTRTYNSRSTFDGIFGFGWCSDFETKLEVLPDSTLKVTECGGGQEIVYSSGQSLKGPALKKYIDKLVTLSKKTNPRLKAPYLKRLRKDLKNNRFLREALAKELGLKGKAQRGQAYYAIGRSAEKILFEGQFYKRILADGTFQKFTLSGKLASMFDRNGNYLQISYLKSRIASISDNNGNRLEFKFNANGKVFQIASTTQLKATYRYSGQDLVKVTNAWANSYVYAYDGLHNLVSIKFPDGSKKAIRYDKDRDLVLSFSDRNKCSETYTYQSSKEDPRNHYWSTVIKKCGKKVTNKSKYEFWHRTKSDGSGKYLYRVLSNNNGDVTDVVYHDHFGRPTLIKKGRITTRYSYNKFGLIRTKIDNTRRLTYEYERQCKKVSSVVTEVFGPRVSGRKVVKRTKNIFRYDKPKCNLTSATNSIGQLVKLNYDRYGRINKLIDHTSKIVTLTYDQRVGKPRTVKRPGLGTIKIVYDDNGDIREVKSDQGPEVATQVASIFNHLLDVIAPATNELNI